MHACRYDRELRAPHSVRSQHHRPEECKVLAFSDEVTLIEQDVVRGVLGTITLDHGAPCTSMPLTEKVMQSIAEFNQLIKLIESGEVNGKANV